MEAERQLGDLRAGVSVTNCLTPFWKETGQPVLTRMPGVDAHFVSVFDDVDKLHKQMVYVIGPTITHSEISGTPVLGVSFPEEPPYSIKQITDGMDFVRSILATPGTRIMLNPRVVEGGKTRWTEITLPENL